MDKGIDRVVAHTVFSSEVKNLVSSKSYWDAAWRSFSRNTLAWQSSQKINLSKMSWYNYFSLCNFHFWKLIYTINSRQRKQPVSVLLSFMHFMEAFKSHLKPLVLLPQTEVLSPLVSSCCERSGWYQWEISCGFGCCVLREISIPVKYFLHLYF